LELANRTSLGEILISAKPEKKASGGTHAADGVRRSRFHEIPCSIEERFTRKSGANQQAALKRLFSMNS
jgi:hypothetical protein